MVKKNILAVLVMLFAGMNGEVMAEWVRVHSNDKVVTYADTASLRRKVNIVKVWTMFDFKEESTYRDGSQYSSIMRETEFNCKDGMQRMVAFSIHTGKMGRGKMIDSGTLPQDWKPVSRANIALDMKKFACDRE